MWGLSDRPHTADGVPSREPARDIAHPFGSNT